MSKGFHSVWKFKEELIDMLEDGYYKKNTSTTMIRKTKKFLKDNFDNIKPANYESLSKENFNRFLRYRRCFEILKSGYFKINNCEHYLKLSDIKGIVAYNNGTYELKIQDGETFRISEENYWDLETIIK